MFLREPVRALFIDIGELPRAILNAPEEAPFAPKG
jgi:hypothetical protein